MPNLLFITADQWRGDCLSLFDKSVVQTPHLDTLAAESVVFERHYANAVPCGPSRASLHTGLYLHNHRSGTNGTPLDARFSNWARSLRSQGHDPVLFGYTHTSVDPRGLPDNDPALNNDEGILPGIRPVIDMGTLCPDWRRYLASKGYQLPEVDGATYSIRDVTSSTEQSPTPLAIRSEDTDTAYLTDEVIKHIDQAREGQSPWCVHLSLRAPHPPWVAPAPYHTRYPLDSLPEPNRHETSEREGATHPWLAEYLGQGRNRSHDDPVRHRKLQASYYGLMSEVDDNMGRLIAWLKTNNQWQDTIFIFTSDHGEQMGDHWLYGKCGYFESSFHVPMIVRAPGIKPGRFRGFTEHVDVFPTLMELYNLEVPRQCDGTSLCSQLAGDLDHTNRSEVHFEYDFRHSAGQATLGLDMESACLNVVRDERYKYVHFADLPPLLFDLVRDPFELNDIAGDNPKLVAEYAGRLLGWRMRTTDKTLSHLQISREHGLREMHRRNE